MKAFIAAVVATTALGLRLRDQGDMELAQRGQKTPSLAQVDLNAQWANRLLAQVDLNAQWANRLLAQVDLNEVKPSCGADVPSEVKSWFDYVDIDNSGHHTPEEVIDVLEKKYDHLKSTHEEIADTLASYLGNNGDGTDDGNGDITAVYCNGFNEFMKLNSTTFGLKYPTPTTE